MHQQPEMFVPFDILRIIAYIAKRIDNVRDSFGQLPQKVIDQRRELLAQ
jgi:hypothetical protein